MTPALAAGQFGSVLNLAMTQASSTKASQAAASPAMLKAKANAQDFEAMFLSQMFQHMMTGIDGEGPFGGSTGVGVWRSFLTDEFARAVAHKGGLGIADQVMGALISEQAAATSSSIAPAGAGKDL